MLLDPDYTPRNHAVFSDSGFSSRATNRVYADRFAFEPPPEAVDPDASIANGQRTQFRRLQRKSRQLSEHNNRTLQAVWRRLKRMPWRPDDFDLIIETCLMLHNLNARRVSHSNQSATLYMEAYLREFD